MELVRYENNELVVENEVINLLKDFQKKKIEMEIQEKQLREELLEAMEKYGVHSWQTEDGSIKAIYKKASKRTTIDTKRLKEELPDIAEEYSKESEVKSSVALTIEV